MTLTKREKRLLYTLLYFMIAALGLFLLLPAQRSYTRENEELARLQQEQEQMQLAISRINTLEAEISALTTEIGNKSLRYRSFMVNEKLDSTMTQRVRINNATPRTMAMAEQQPVVLEPYGGGELTAQLPGVAMNMSYYATLENAIRLADVMARDRSMMLNTVTMTRLNSQEDRIETTMDLNQLYAPTIPQMTSATATQPEGAPEAPEFS